MNVLCDDAKVYELCKCLKSVWLEFYVHPYEKKYSKTKQSLFTSVLVQSECHVSALKLQVQVQVLKLVCGAENISFSSWADLKSTLKSTIEASGERGVLLSLLPRLSDLLLQIAP